MATPSAPLTAQEAALRAVRQRYERGEISHEEFVRVLDALLLTTDPAAIATLLASAAPSPAVAMRALERAGQPEAPLAAPRVPGFRFFFLLLGELAKTRRPWKLGRLSLGLMVLGETTLDLRLATLPRRGTLIFGSLIGETTIIVPRGVQVTATAFTLIGESNALGESSGGFFTFTREDADGAPTSPRLSIIALGALGQVTIVQRDDAPRAALVATTPRKELL